MTRKIATYVLCLMVLFGPAACTTPLLTEQQREGALAAAEGQFQRGEISADELAGIRALLEKDRNGETLENLLWAIGTLVGGAVGINFWRGSPNKRKGTAPKA